MKTIFHTFFLPAHLVGNCAHAYDKAIPCAVALHHLRFFTYTFPNIRDFISQSELGSISVTSRHPDSNAMVANQSNHFIKLFGLEEDAAVALLIQQSQTNEGISEDEKMIVERLVCHRLK